MADLSNFDCDSPGLGLNVIPFSEKNTANSGALLICNNDRTLGLEGTLRGPLVCLAP